MLMLKEREIKMGKITITIDNATQDGVEENYFTKYVNVERFTKYVVNQLKNDPLFDHTVINVTRRNGEYNLRVHLPGAS